MLTVRHQSGVSMIEVLVAIMILTVGLLGAAGMQSRLQVAEVEAYQRAQAIVLLQDMVDRINANRSSAAIAAYVTGTTTPLGDTNADGDGDYTDTAPAGCTAAPTTAATVAQRDKCEWESAIIGASEKKSGNKLGAMNGARGCITNPVTTMPREVEVALVWQGMTPTKAPTSTTCGSGAYGTDDRHRRALVAKIKIGCLQNNITSGLCVTP